MEGMFKTLLERLRTKGFTFEPALEGYVDWDFEINGKITTIVEAKDEYTVLKETTETVVGYLHPYQRFVMGTGAAEFAKRFPDVDQEKLQEIVQLAKEGKVVESGKGRTGYVTYATYKGKKVPIFMNYMPLWHPVTYFDCFSFGENKVCVHNLFEIDSDEFDEICAVIEPEAKALGFEFEVDPSVEGF